MNVLDSKKEATLAWIWAAAGQKGNEPWVTRELHPAAVTGFTGWWVVGSGGGGGPGTQNGPNWLKTQGPPPSPCQRVFVRLEL